MPFRFALAPLLRLRQSIERQRTLQLQDASLQVSRAQETLTQIDRFLPDSAQSDAKTSPPDAPPPNSSSPPFCARTCGTFARNSNPTFASSNSFASRRPANHLAYREREVLETLRARERRAYQQEQSRRQQRELDAAYLLQRWHHHN